MNRLEFFRSFVSVGLFLAYAPVAHAQPQASCQPERILTDKPQIVARIPIVQIQDELERLSKTSKALKNIDQLSFSTTTGVIRVSGTINVPTEKLYARIQAPAGSNASETFGFNLSFRPTVENKCGETYLSLQFLRVSLEQNDLMAFFQIVQNLVEAVLGDESVKNYVAGFLAKPLGFNPEEVATLLDPKNFEADGKSKILRIRLNFSEIITRVSSSTRVSDGARRVLTNPALAKALSELRLWTFGPEITRSSGSAGDGYDAGFAIEIGRGVPNEKTRERMDATLASDREYVQQAMAADLAKFGDPTSLRQLRTQLIADATAKLVRAKGGVPLGVIEKRKVADLQAELEKAIVEGLKIENPLFSGDPEAQSKELGKTVESRVLSTFAALERDLQMNAVIEREAGKLKSVKESVLVEQRTSEKTLNDFLRYLDSVNYDGQPVFRELEIKLNPAMEEIALRGYLHMNIPGYTKGFLDPKVAQGLSGTFAKYLPFILVGKFVFTPQAELLFNLQSLALELPGITLGANNVTNEKFVITRANKAGQFIFDSVEQLVAAIVVPKLVGMTPQAKLVIDTLKATGPKKQGDMIVASLDLAQSPLRQFMPPVIEDVRFWRVGTHDSKTVGRRFLELGGGSGAISKSYWEQQKARHETQVARLEEERSPKKEVPVDMQLRVALPGLKDRIDFLLANFSKTQSCELGVALNQKEFKPVVVPDSLKIDFPSKDELKIIAGKLQQHARERGDRNAPLEELSDVFKISFKGTAHLVNPKFFSFFKKDYTFDIAATLYLKLSLIDISKFDGNFLREPLYLGRQVLEISLVHGAAEVSGNAIARAAGWGAKQLFDLDDADFVDPKSEKLKIWFLKFLLPKLDNEKGSFVFGENAQASSCDAIAGRDPNKHLHLNKYVRFFSTDRRFALQLNPRLFSATVDMQIVHPADAKPGENEILFEGQRIGLRIDTRPEVNMASLDGAIRPTLAAVDDEEFTQIVKDSTTLLGPMGAARTADEFLAALKAAKLNDRFLRPLRRSDFEERSIVGRLNHLTRVYTFLSRTGNRELMDAPEALGTGLDTITYAKTLIEIDRLTAKAIATAKRLGLESQLLNDPDFRPFLERHRGKKADGSDSVRNERIEPLLKVYREKFLKRNQDVLASPADSDWTRAFRAESKRAQDIYNAISR